MNWLRRILFGWSESRLAGNDAYYDGKSEDANPHAPGTPDHLNWRRGFYGSDKSPALVHPHP
jgi:hypothetical protein